MREQSIGSPERGPEQDPGTFEVNGARTWDELVSIIERKGGFTGKSGYQPASEILPIIELVRQGALGSGSPVFKSLTRGEGLRAKARELADKEKQVSPDVN